MAEISTGAPLLEFTYHKGLEVPHYHMYWWLCDKKAPRTPSDTENPCGPSSRSFTLTFRSDRPGIYKIDYETKDVQKFEAVIGAQSYPKFVSVPIAELYDPKFEIATLTIDTNAGNFSLEHSNDE
ncbi:hypothetical protein Dda_5582 [Drechslerella dactyloides]|uniref:Uncharacterized protein n=1 Tax=Drechslerella dactyloides TaxID=74499 RepID=A0AAD6IWC8_DREDA|nr:hypothetical protein Dda_5582 [Drechslerella dactyloides]